MELLENAEMQERRNFIKENTMIEIIDWTKEWNHNE
jgi:hypothetical protein